MYVRDRRREWWRIFERIVVPTTLEPIPPLLRTAFGCIAMNTREIAAFRAGDPDVFKFVTETCRAADARDALGIEGYRRRRRRVQAERVRRVLRSIRTASATRAIDGTF